MFLELILVSNCVGGALCLSTLTSVTSTPSGMDLAAETTDPNAQEILVSTAQNWERLASKLADAQEELLAQCLR